MNIINKKSLTNIICAAFLSSGIFGCDNNNKENTYLYSEETYSCSIRKLDIYNGMIGAEKVTYSYLTYYNDITETVARFHHTRMLKVEASDGTKIEYLAYGNDLDLDRIVVTKDNMSNDIPAFIFRDTAYFKEQQIKFIEYIKLIHKEE